MLKCSVEGARADGGCLGLCGAPGVLAEASVSVQLTWLLPKAGPGAHAKGSAAQAMEVLMLGRWLQIAKKQKVVGGLLSAARGR